jgi:endonuclease/exonuclease/phosphatase family metal-dependent hydrolase
VDVAVTSIGRRRADLVALDELCQQQYESVRGRLAAAGWGRPGVAFSAFAATLPSGSPKVCSGHAYGIGLFSRAPIHGVTRTTLPDDGTGEPRALLCARLAHPSGVVFCTTHISTSDAPAADGRAADEAQLEAVLSRIEGYHAHGDTVLIAGDFNAQPSYGRLDDWYSGALETAANHGNTGAYDELGDSDATHCAGYGEWTATGPPGGVPPCAGTTNACPAGGALGCAKIDMIFVRRDRVVGRYTERALPIAAACAGVPPKPGYYARGSCSDHRALIGTVRVLTGAGGAARSTVPARSGR